MKLYFLFAVINLAIMLVYPIAYIVHRMQKLTGKKIDAGMTCIGLVDFPKGCILTLD